MIPLHDENPTSRPAVVTMVLIAVCVGVFLFVQPEASRTVSDPGSAALIEEFEFTYEWAAIPCELTQWRPLTLVEIARAASENDTTACIHGDPGPGARTPFPDKSLLGSVMVSLFLHGDWIHLIGNMVFLWVFGNNIEDHLGAIRHRVFYLAAGVVATAAHVLAGPDSTVPLVGASGAIAGVMGAYLVWFPWARVRTLVFIVIVPLWPRIPAAALLVVWFALQFVTDPNTGTAWAAHVGGFAFGAAVAIVARTDPRFRNRLWVHRHRTTGVGWDNRRGPGPPPPPPRP